MLNQKKIRLMTRMAIFEESAEGKEALRISKYYKHDYVRWELIKTIMSITIGYLLILVLIVLYHAEYLIANAVTLNYKEIAMKAIGAYLILLVVYVSASLVGYSYKFSRERRNLTRYYKSLKRLRGIYAEEDKENVRQEVSAK